LSKLDSEGKRGSKDAAAQPINKFKKHSQQWLWVDQPPHLYFNMLFFSFIIRFWYIRPEKKPSYRPLNHRINQRRTLPPLNFEVIPHLNFEVIRQV